MERRIILVLFLLSAVFVGSSMTLFVIDETDVAIVTRFGDPRRTISAPGLYFKSPLDTVERMESRVLGSDTRPTEYLTLDKKRLVADPITRWRIADPLKFFKTVGDEDRARNRLDAIVGSELRDEIARVKFGDMIGNARDPLMTKVRDRVAVKAKEFGIETVDVRIKRADLPPQVQESVFARMRAERDREAKRYRSEGSEEAAKVRADTDKERTIILAKAYEKATTLRGEGDAESTRVYAEAFGKDAEFYAFLRALDSYEVAITKDSQLVVSTGSELFRYFNSSKKR